MKAAVFESHGPAENLKITDIREPSIGINDIKLKVNFCSLNRLDIWVRNGSPLLNIPLPHIGGSDFTGTVLEIGVNVNQFKIGDSVVVHAGLGCRKCARCIEGQHTLCDTFKMMGEHTSGGLAEIAVVPAINALKIPDHINLLETTAVSLTLMTAYRMIYSQAKLKDGELILITGATGGVGVMAIQLAKLKGAKVIALSSSQWKSNIIKELGVDYIINYKDKTWVKQIQLILKTENKIGVDVVFDSVGETVFRPVIRLLRKGGRFVTCGATSGYNAKINLGALFWNQISIIGSTMANDSEFAEALQLFFDGKIKAIIHKTYKLSDIILAHKELENSEFVGKIVIELQQD